jgi:uncharacterized protein (DUF433 family)
MMTRQTGRNLNSSEPSAWRRGLVSRSRPSMTGGATARPSPSATTLMSSSTQCASLNMPDQSKGSIGSPDTSHHRRRCGSGWSRPIRTPIVRHRSTGCGQGTSMRLCGLRKVRLTTSEDTNSKRDDTIVSDPEILGGMPVIRSTRVLIRDLAASVKAGIPRDRILAVYPTIKEHHLDLAVAYAEANPLPGQTRHKLPPWPGATLLKSGRMLRRKR